MKSLLRWLLPLMLITIAVLAWGGFLDPNLAFIAGVGIELILLVVVIRSVIVATLSYRRNRAEQADVGTAILRSLTAILPPGIAHLAALEPRLWAAIYRWLIARRPLSPDEFSYHKRSSLTLLLVLVAFTTPIELLAAELLVPWEWLRWLLLILAIYGLVWLFGLYGSLRTLPHRLESEGLRLRYGLLAEVFIPYTQIAVVETLKRKHEHNEGLKVIPQNNAAYIPVGGHSNIGIALNNPITLQGLFGPTRPVKVIRFAADDWKTLAARLEAISGR